MAYSSSQRFVSVGSVLAAAVIVAGVRSPSPAQQPTICACSQTRDFGSCASRIQDAVGNAYPGEFPGGAVALEHGNDRNLLIADLYTGFTYRYNAQDISQQPAILASPLGNQTSSGIAFQPARALGGDPPLMAPARLYWAVEVEFAAAGGGTRRGARVFSTEPPEDGSTVFSDLKDHGEIDLEAVARALDPPASAGVLGGITYHEGRDTLWAVDIANDVYFELVKVFTGAPDSTEFTFTPATSPPSGIVHFPNPLRHPFGGGAYGNSLTYVRLADGGEFFDLLVGALADERPTSVHRVHAPTDPAAAGVALGADAGLRYPVVPNLIRTARQLSAFPAAIAYFGNSCQTGQNSEFIVVFDVLSDPHSLVEVAVDERGVANVSDFASAATGSGAVQLSWRTSPLLRTLRIVRRSLTDPAQPEAQVFTVDTSVAPDPGGVLDATIPFPPDGTYVYTAMASNAASNAAPSVSSTVTVGRGSPGTAVHFSGGPLNGPLIGGSTPRPYAVTSTATHLLVVDRPTGVAERFRLTDLGSDGVVNGPFLEEGATVGAAFNSRDGRVYWLATLGTTPFLQSTLPDGTARGERVLVRFPNVFLRGPTYGDLSYDAARDIFWVCDLHNEAIYAIDATGRFVAGTLASNPLVGGALGGGLHVAESDATTITFDISEASSAVGIVDRVLRVRFTRADLSLPETLYVLDLRSTTGSALIGGIDTVAVGVGEAARPVLVATGTDTSTVYTLRLDPSPPPGLPLRRGDANNDARLNISDPSFVLNFLFRGGAAPACADAADVDDSGRIEVTDAIALFNYLFRGMAAPALPGPECGFDLSPSSLRCDASQCDAAPGA